MRDSLVGKVDGDAVRINDLRIDKDVPVLTILISRLLSFFNSSLNQAYIS